MFKYYFISISLVSILLSSCTKNRSITGFDAELFSKAQKTDGFVYYNLNTDFIKSSDKAGHKSTYARTKFDATAATMLDEKGEIISGSDFPNGSLIVNEMSNDNATTIKYAIMFKDPSNPYADNNGWVWSYVNADNTIIEPSTRHGISCVGCHSNGIK